MTTLRSCRVTCLAMALVLCATISRGADKSILKTQDRESLAFWEVGFSNFEAEVPRLIAMPAKAGKRLQYWYWRYSFEPKTHLQGVRPYYQKISQEASPVPLLEGVEGSPRTLYLQHLARIDKTIEQAAATKVHIALHADDGRILPDLSLSDDPALKADYDVVRNVLEHKLKIRLYTTAELRNRKLTELKPSPLTKKIEAVAIFPRINPRVREFEIRVVGMGERYTPSYTPGDLLFLQKTYDASLRRAYRFQYRRLGASGIDYLDKVKLEEKKSDWVWMWPGRIYGGRHREIEVVRDYGLKTETLKAKYPELKRTYIYMPYRLWNDTHIPQSFAVQKAGINCKLKWRGLSVRFPVYDMGEADRFWKTAVMRTIRSRIVNDQEMQHVEQYEKGSLPNDPKRIAKDLKRKADFMPEGKRHIDTILPPQAQVKGLIVIRWGLDNLQEVVDGIVRDLRIMAVTGMDDSTGLSKAYQTLRKPLPNEKQKWNSLPEPKKEAVVELLKTLATEDLAEKDIEISQDDKVRYGELAPIGAVLNALARESLNARADQGVIDTFFEVKWDNVIDRASFPIQFNRLLPEKRKTFTPPPADDEMGGEKSGDNGFGDDVEEKDDVVEKDDGGAKENDAGKADSLW